MNKKGVSQQLLLTISYIIFAIIIFFIFYFYVSGQANNEALLKYHKVRDISLMIDTINSAEGEVTVRYPFESSSLQIKDGKIIVDDAEFNCNKNINNINLQGKPGCMLIFNKKDKIIVKGENCG